MPLYILATGTNLPIHIVSASSEIPEVITVDTLFSEAYFSLDSRQSNSKGNRILGYKIQQALSKGLDIFLIAPEAGMIDKRLRNLATIITLPGQKRSITIPGEED